MKEEKVRIPLTKKGLAEDLDNGLTRPEIAKKYDLSEGMIKKALVDVGLSKKRAAIKGYVIVPDEPDEPQAESSAPTTTAAILTDEKITN